MATGDRIILKKAVDKSLQKNLAFQLDRAQIEQLKTLSQVVLAVVGVAGVIALAAAAPNIFVALNECKKVSKKFRHLAADEKQKKFERTFYYLRGSGFIRLAGEKSNLSISLTEKGKTLLRRLNFQTMRVPKAKVWDKKWWLVAADIPTKEHRPAADRFRQKLKDMGLYTLQRTLWLYPFDPRPQIRFIAESYYIHQFITVMEINRLDREDEAKARLFFGL